MFKSVKSAIVGVVIGLILIPGSVCLHVWNEYRTIHRTKGINEAAEAVLPIADSNQIDPNLNDKLVFLSGQSNTEERLIDELFSIEVPSVRLRRNVEMYQWVQHSEKNKNNEHKTYEYRQQWKAGRVDSSSFRNKSYVNPALGIKELNLFANEVTVGAYRLNKSLKNDLNAWDQVQIEPNAVLENIAVSMKGAVAFDGNQIYVRGATADQLAGNEEIDTTRKGSDASIDEQGFDWNVPEIGDLRITIEVVREGPVSLMAKQTGNTFSVYKTTNNESFERLYCEAMDVDGFVDRLRSENTILAWILRGGGGVLCFVGFSLLLGPIRSLTNWIPVLGDLTNALLFGVAALLAAGVSLVTIAVAWIAVRPLLGIALLVAAAGIVYLIIRIRKKATQPTIVTENMFAD